MSVIHQRISLPSETRCKPKVDNGTKAVIAFGVLLLFAWLGFTVKNMSKNLGPSTDVGSLQLDSPDGRIPPDTAPIDVGKKSSTEKCNWPWFCDM